MQLPLAVVHLGRNRISRLTADPFKMPADFLRRLPPDLHGYFFSVCIQSLEEGNCIFMGLGLVPLCPEIEAIGLYKRDTLTGKRRRSDETPASICSLECNGVQRCSYIRITAKYF